jgi:CTP synthase
MKKVAGEVDVGRETGHRGDIESLPLEAIRQMRHEEGRVNCCSHVTPVPWIAAAHELKTKLTQHPVKGVNGIQPDILICRSERFIPQDMKEKIALFCDVDVRAVVTARDVKSVYEVPVVFAGEGVDEIILHNLRINAPPRDLSRWMAMLERMENPRGEVSIAIVGKYVEYEDSYKSLNEALYHGGLANQLQVHIHWLEAEGVGRRLGAPA